jgi:hypothetical protein
MYPAPHYYLQNIATGQFKRDPATPGGRVFDDLNAPSGSGRLCSPLRYPHIADPHFTSFWYLGSLTFFGKFAFEYGDGPIPGSPIYQLARCGTKLHLSAYTQPVVSSSAFIVSPNGIDMRGWFLPSMRRFTIKPGLPDYTDVVALDGRTLYVRTRYFGQLWETTLPSPT